jgi:hypothetical protein
MLRLRYAGAESRHPLFLIKMGGPKLAYISSTGKKLKLESDENGKKLEKGQRTMTQ